ncbi:MAG TPA: HEAT repeat domain-containing protein [Anaeromyxobacteraceae bacterium]|nr:HEAT repeat domain-containing protein [Anaeromyxobacteraceae bacterium]
MANGTRQGGAGPGPAPARALRWVLFALLLAAAAWTLLFEPKVDPGRGVARAAGAVAAGLLGIFAVGFAVYRYLLVRAGRYPAGKAFVQVGLVLAVVALVIGSSLERRRETGPAVPVELGRPLVSIDPEMRAMAAELARHRGRGEGLRHVPRLIELLEDRSAEVRRQAHASLVALAGVDAGGEGADAVPRWRAYWRERGIPPGEAH